MFSTRLQAFVDEDGDVEMRDAPGADPYADEIPAPISNPQQSVSDQPSLMNQWLEEARRNRPR